MLTFLVCFFLVFIMIGIRDIGCLGCIGTLIFWSVIIVLLVNVLV